MRSIKQTKETYFSIETETCLPGGKYADKCACNSGFQIYQTVKGDAGITVYE